MEDIFDVIDFKPVSEIKLVEDCYVDKLRDSLSHLPLCSTIDFCRNNDLDFKNYLSQQSL